MGFSLPRDLTPLRGFFRFCFFSLAPASWVVAVMGRLLTLGSEDLPCALEDLRVALEAEPLFHFFFLPAPPTPLAPVWSLTRKLRARIRVIATFGS